MKKHQDSERTLEARLTAVEAALDLAQARAQASNGDCISYTELQRLASGNTPPSSDQLEHLGECLTCRVGFVASVVKSGGTRNPLVRESALGGANACSPRWARFVH